MGLSIVFDSVVESWPLVTVGRELKVTRQSSSPHVHHDVRWKAGWVCRLGSVIPVVELNPRADARWVLGLLAGYGIVFPPMEKELRVVPRLVSSGQVALDIGANVGSYTFQLSRLVGSDGLVIAFEPYFPSVVRLRRGASIVHASNIVLIERAVTDYESTAWLSRPRPAVGGYRDALIHLERVQTRDSIPVRTTTLDKVVKQMNLARVDFIKCDVEGAEFMVLEGGHDTIAKYQPIILCEIQEAWAARYGKSVASISELLSRVGEYSSYVYEGDRILPSKTARQIHSNQIFLTTRAKERLVQSGVLLTC